MLVVCLFLQSKRGRVSKRERILKELKQYSAVIVRDVPGVHYLHYLAYFPAAVFLEKIPANEMWIGLAVQALWVLAFIGVSRVMLNRGLHRYSGFGG